MEHKRNHPVALDIFNRIQNEFPNLSMELDSDPSVPVDLLFTINKQDGLEFDISLNLQNFDEIHLSTCHIDCSFFPITKENVSETIINSVKGIISGNYRVVQIKNKKGKTIKSLLQRSEGDKWITTYRSFENFRFPWTRVEHKVYRNNHTGEFND